MAFVEVALVVLYVFICFFLILVVLLQQGKGADIAGAFGGGGTQTAFGARGAFAGSDFAGSEDGVCAGVATSAPRADEAALAGSFFGVGVDGSLAILAISVR